MGNLTRANVSSEWTTRLPTGGDPYGNGAAVVVRRRENRLHGEGRQVSEIPVELTGGARCTTTYAKT